MSEESVRLASVVFALESGARPKGGVSKTGDIPSLGGEHLNSDGGFRLHNTKRIPRAFFLSLNTGRIQLHDILIVKDGATTGKTSYVNADFPYPEAAINEHVFRLVINPEKADSRYVFHFLASERGQFEILKDFRGSTIGGISRKFVDGVEIPLPSLAEQKRIAALLDEAEALRRKRREAIARLDALLQSVFLEMFGDPFTNPKGWTLATLGELGNLDRGKSKHRPRNAPELYGGVHPFIQTGDVANAQNYIERYQQTYSEVGLKQSKLWQRGTLCITIAANIAKTAILTFDACFPDSVVGFIPNHRTFTEYVYAWFGFMQKYLESIAPESAQKNINLEILRALSIPEPPIEFQKKFVGVFRELIALRTKMSEASEKAEVLFSNIQHEAFYSKSEPTITENSLPSCLTLDF